MEGSKLCKIFGLLLTFIAASLAQNEVILTADSTNVLLGETITLKCVVPGWVAGYYGEWFKMGRDGAKLKLATNADSDGTTGDDLPSFSYAIDIIEDEGGVELTMTIENAETRYSGTYSCNILTGTGEIGQEIDINVLTEPTSITMFIDNEELASNDVKEFEGYTSINVRCEAAGGNPEPMIHVMNGEMDITQRFETNGKVDVEPTDVTAFETPTGRGTAVADLQLDSSFRDNQLYCKAHTMGMHGGNIESSKYRIEFQGTPPEINCHMTQFVLDPHSSVELNCSVNANPPISSASITFERRHNGSVVTLDEMNHEYGRYVHFKKVEDPNDGFRHYVILSIEHLSEQMFREYTIHVKNDIGMAEQIITLESNPDWEYTAGVAMLSFSLVTLISATLAALWL